jgi:hypothetical protein
MIGRLVVLVTVLVVCSTLKLSGAPDPAADTVAVTTTASASEALPR